MKCGGCGQDGFKNIGEVNRHKADGCKGQAKATEESNKVVIPWHLVEDGGTYRDALAGSDYPIVMELHGSAKAEGIEVESVQELRRRK